MAANLRSDTTDLRATSRLLVDATTQITSVVEAMHRTISSGPRVLGAPFSKPAAFFAGLTYGSVRQVTRLVGFRVDKALAQLEPYLAPREAGPARQALLAILNGVLGDTLTTTGSPLAIPLQLRQGGTSLDPSAQKGQRLLVLLHGSSMTDLQWRRAAHDHGAALAQAHGFTSVYALYNSGTHVSTNGRELAVLLKKTVAEWPVDVHEVVLLGHSMGGLLARSAAHVAEVEGLQWRARLSALVTLGTPHHGTLLERAGAWTDFALGLRAESAPLRVLAQVRSAGITDLRYGNVRDEDWQGHDRFVPGVDRRVPTPLPAGVRCFAVAGTRAPAPREDLPGDGLVGVDSALGHHASAAQRLNFLGEYVAFGCSHLDLLSDPEVYSRLVGWLEA